MRTKPTTADRLRDFEARHGYVVVNALQVQERDMRRIAEQTLADAYRPASPPPPEREGFISLVPHPQGLAQAARMFTESADRAAEALQAWEELTDPEGEQE